jgi:antitoxin (DNA-binding transcriptional repressor) of toxin-antitoxin stability system
MNMRNYFHEVTEDFGQALRALKAGKEVVLTEHGVPLGMLQPMRPASAEEEIAIQEMIDSGDLQPTRTSGTIKEWKWKATRKRAA